MPPIAPRSLLIALGVVAAGAGGALAQTVTCDSCSDCTAKLASGSYEIVVLTTDIVDHGGSCISLLYGESDLVFDCDGHLIDGDDVAVDPDSGIAMYHGIRNTIRNCRVSGFTYGIELADVAGCAVSRSTASSNGVGIRLAGSDLNELVNTNAIDNLTGARFESSSKGNTYSFGVACDNANSDMVVDAGVGNTGEGNYCDVTDGWSDSGTTGCSFSCGHRLVFNDGFESGDSSGWTGAVP
jgi:parallel beta-helix repeat protein